MNKKGLILLLCILLLSLSMVFGLTFMTEKMKQQAEQTAVYVTATPAPTDE